LFCRHPARGSGDNYNLGYYLAGLIEGDGSIKVPDQERSDKGKLLTASITIVFVDKDLPLATFLAEILSGTVNKAPGNYYVLSIYKQSALHSLCKLINGKFRTPKIEALHRLINWLNNKNKFKNLELLPLDHSNILSNSWLTGFSDSDANFHISYSIKGQLRKSLLKSDAEIMAADHKNICSSIVLTYRISQRQEYHRSISNFSNNYLAVMSSIAAAFNTRVENISRDRIISSRNISYTEKAYLVRVKNKNSRLKVIKYFDNFNMLSSKHLDYLAWKEAHLLIEKRKYRTVEGSFRLMNLKSSMNTNRTYFNWKHLEEFKSHSLPSAGAFGLEYLK
jgi:LAGLIDADG endonuclease.